MPGDAADGIFLLFFPLIFRKGQFHKWFHIKTYKLALQLHPVFFIGAGAGFPVQCKHKGVKYGRLPGPGITADQEQVLIHLTKVYYGPVPI